MESKNFDRRSPSFRGSSDRFIGVGTRTNRTKESIGQQRTKQEERIHKEAQKQLEHLEQRFGQTTLQEGEEAQRS